MEADKQKAWETTEKLFRNGQNQEASRLLLIKDYATGGHADLGGWCKSAVADIIAEALDTQRENSAKIVESFADDIHMEMADGADIATAIRKGEMNPTP